MAKKPALKKIKTAFGITEYQLSNGLRVLHKRERSAPVVAVCVTFHVGSRNEAPGHTGSTHILEHLLFKDSRKFNQKNGKPITNYLDWFGAYINATTWLDRTNYFEVLPREKLKTALELEADRMRYSLFNEKDLESEMTVVRNEYERSRNNPFELLDEEVVAKAFTTHPYRIPTIGTKEDIEGSSVKKLREFYDTFYWPNNATLAVIGDVQWREVAPLVLKFFGPITASKKPIPEMNIVEPPQQESRFVELLQPLGVQIVMLSYKTPAGIHADFPALFVLGAILGNGFSSRLQKELVDTGLAADVGLMAMPLHDPYVLSFIAHVAGGEKPERVQNAMRSTIEGIAKSDADAGELKRAKERLLAQAAFERDGVLSQARAISESIASGDWTLSFRFEKAIAAVKSADIKRVARAYLTKENETIGILRDANTTSVPSQ